MKPGERYYSLNRYLREKFGCRVQKVTVDAGFTCPNRDGFKGTGGCIYCNSHGSGNGNYIKKISIGEQVKKGIEFLSKRYKAKKFIAYFQAYSNTYGSVKVLKEKYDAALIDDRIIGLAIGTRPDCITEEIGDLLESYKKRGYMVWLEMGLQSVHNKTLKLINRHHSYENFLKSLEMAKERKLLVCSHIIFGLPGESLDEMRETGKKLSKLPIDGVKFHSLYVVRNTFMEKLFMEGKYNPINCEDYVKMVCNTLAELPEKVVIQRLTGEPEKEELIAPEWTGDKKKTIKMIDDMMIERNLWQGKYSRL